MKCKALFFTLLLLPITVSAQNLVPNGSFEDYVSCPEYLDGMEFVEHWYKSIQEPGVDYYQNPSPDYFHECAIAPAVGVPDNVIGNQLAYEGSSYSGLVSYDFTSGNYREILGVELTSALMPGQTYYCSFRYVRPVGWSIVGLATDNLGMKFSNSEFYTSADQAMDGFAHLKVEEVAIDSVNWVLLYGEVIPEQSYQYIHIGNFFSDQDTYVESFDDESMQGYYFIDDIRVSTEPLDVTSYDSHESIFTLSVFPNPVNETLNIVSSEIVSNVEIVDVSGRLVEEFVVREKSKFSLDLEHILKGLYIAVVYFDDGGMQTINVIKN